MTETHIFVGPPGTGKTTVLCKWLAQLVRRAHSGGLKVWRLDGKTSNHAEFLTIYSELLGVPLERLLPASSLGEGAHLVDLPGVGVADEEGHHLLHRHLSVFQPAQTHLVLNAAYDASVLWQQFAAFRMHKVDDLILTHLDEAGPLARLRPLLVELGLPIRHMNEDNNLCTNLLRPGEPPRVQTWQSSCSGAREEMCAN